MDFLHFFSGRNFDHVGWNQESYPHYQDLLVVLPFFVLFFPFLRFVLDKLVFEKLAERLMFGNEKDGAKLKPSSKTRRINKFKECAWKTVYSLSAEILAILVIYNEPWFSNTRYFWTGPEGQVWPDQKMKFKLKLLYMYCGGFYTYAIFAVLFFDIRRSDFIALLAHHVATVILIVLSYIFRCGSVGAVILALHEGSDVFLETAKMSKYSGFQSLANCLFAMFALSWWILRLGFYPFWVLRSTSYEVLTILGKDNKTTEETILYCVFNALLFGLLGLHLYWGKILLKMTIAQIKAKGQIGNDARSDSEDEDEHRN